MGSVDFERLIPKDDLLVDGVLDETGFVVDIGAYASNGTGQLVFQPACLSAQLFILTCDLN